MSAVTPEAKARRVVQKRAYNKRLREEDPIGFSTIRKDRALRTRYGISLKQFHMLHREQGGKCFLCHTLLDVNRPAKNNGPVVDHDHVSGEVRGIAHLVCNRALGIMGDTPGALRLRAMRLEEQSKRTQELLQSPMNREE